MKKISRIFTVKKVGGWWWWWWWGGGGVATAPTTRPEREGVAAKITKLFVIFIFLFFPFVITMTMFLKYLRHKVDLVKCFTLSL